MTTETIASTQEARSSASAGCPNFELEPRVNSRESSGLVGVGGVPSSRIIVVCGFPRSGTSLTMQMLCAAGVRCAGEWPAFEHDACGVQNGKVPRELMEKMRGGAVKVLDPQHIALPRGFIYDFIWMRRNRNEQAVSFFKFLRAVGMPVQDTKWNRAKIADSMKDDEPRAQRILRAHEGHRWYPLRFEDLVDRPDLTVELLAKFLGLPPQPMRACIVRRGSACLRGMLEVAQLDSERAAGVRSGDENASEQSGANSDNE